MIHKEFDRIGKEDLENLIENEVAEDKTIEYKLELPGTSDGAKKEFLADISSFANAIGGDIIYGVREKLDENGRNTGLPEEITGLSGINPDEVIRRLENSIRDGIAPRINGARLKTIEGFRDGPVIVIRVPNSWLAPHMIVFKGTQRFYSRNNAGKYPLDIIEIRSAFALSESIPEKIRQFRDGRLAKIIAGDTPLPLLDNPKIVLHILPIQSLDPAYALDLASFGEEVGNFWPMFVSGMDQRYNFDGILTFTNEGAPPYRSYLQLFRNGAIEAVEAHMLCETQESGRVIPYGIFGDEIIKSFGQYLNGLRNVGLGLPLFVMLSLIGMKDYRIPTGGWLEGVRQPTLIERDTLLLPDILVDDFSVPPDVILRPAFDTLWQAAGFRSCPHYDKDRRWKPSR